MFKQKVIIYNHEDCQALRTVANCLAGISVDDNATTYPVMHTDQIRRGKPYDLRNTSS
jgi:hypothetical protein